MLKLFSIGILMGWITSQQAVAAEAHPPKVIRLKPRKITVAEPKVDELQVISNNALKLEADADTLQTNVQASRQRLLEDTRIDHSLDIKLNLIGLEQAHFRLLELRLDGFPVFNVNENTGLWTNKDSLSIYSGPIMPGKHEAVIAAKVAFTPTEGNALTETKLGNLERSIPFTIALDQKTEEIVLNVKLDENNQLSLDQKKEAPKVTEAVEP